MFNREFHCIACSSIRRFSIKLCLFAAAFASVASPVFPARAGTLDVVYSFGTGSKGYAPDTGLILGSDDQYYGTTSQGGKYSHSNPGVIYRYSQSGHYTVIHVFNPSDGGGGVPGQLIEGRDRYLYGTTNIGSANKQGIIFKINHSGTDFQVLYSFPPGNDKTYPSGSEPYGGVFQASDGKLYGTTTSGGAFGYGVLFSINTDGSNFAVLHSFSNSADGGMPTVAPVGDDNGNLYGTTEGAPGTAYIYIIRTGVFRTIHTFTGTDGMTPGPGRLARGSDGTLYGACLYGGANSAGTIWWIKPGGSFVTYTKLFDFPYNYPGLPFETCVASDAGVLYGTTGETYDTGGTLYSINSDGTNFQTLSSFGTTGTAPINPDYGNLLIDTDGSLLGTSQIGGDNGTGTIYRYVP